MKNGEAKDPGMSAAALGLTEKSGFGGESPKSMGMDHAAGSKSMKPIGSSPGYKGGGKAKGM